MPHPPRADGPFIAVNCSAIADQLIESELFGHRRGAFTGALADRAGAFVSAGGGTLLLDEIGDAPLTVQLALLRAIETRRIKPIGADTERAVDVRVFAATSRDLRARMRDGRFREDLYYRLAEHIVELPPLRERREDIAQIAASQVAVLAPKTDARLSEQALRVLIAHDWPGNIRELRNALKRALALSADSAVLEAVHFAHLAESIAAAAAVAGSTEPEIVFPARVRAYAERIWREPEAAIADDASRNEQRALMRAALLLLASETAFSDWPRRLTLQWHRLFGEKWATTEGGRGVREVVRELGMDARHPGAVEAVVRRVRAWKG